MSCSQTLRVPPISVTATDLSLRDESPIVETGMTPITPSGYCRSPAPSPAPLSMFLDAFDLLFETKSEIETNRNNFNDNNQSVSTSIFENIVASANASTSTNSNICNNAIDIAKNNNNNNRYSKSNEGNCNINITADIDRDGYIDGGNKAYLHVQEKEANTFTNSKRGNGFEFELEGAILELKEELESWADYESRTRKHTHSHSLLKSVSFVSHLNK